MENFFEKYKDSILSVPIFAGIDAHDIPIMLKKLGAHTHSYRKEQYIRHCGDSANFLGIVLTGEIHILRDDYDGNRNITAAISEGGLFAEAFACAGIPVLPVDIVAASDCTVLYLNSNTLLNSCDHTCAFHHTLVQNLLGIVARKNMYLNQKLNYISRKTTSEKLLAYLHDQAKQKQSVEFDIPFNRQELADYLGVERSAMSTEISKLVKLGILETQRSHFILKKEIL